MDYLVKLAGIYDKTAQIMEHSSQALISFYRQLLFNSGYYLTDPSNPGNDNQAFVDKWTGWLENSNTYGDYTINMTIPKGTLSVRFSGSPKSLVNYLNTTVAPQVSRALERKKGRRIAEYTITEPEKDLTFLYMSSV